MSTTYDFPLSDFPDDAINSDELVTETKAALPDLLESIGQSGDTITFSFTQDLTSGQQTTLAAVVAAHHAVSLALVKAAKFIAIDTRTDELFTNGYTYQSVQFSLSPEAQRFMIAMFVIRDDPAFAYPVRYNSIDDAAYVDLDTSADVAAMYLAAVGTARACLSGGTSLKNEVRAATTIAEVNAIIDNR